MTVKQITSIPVDRRQFVFDEIRSLVDQHDAINRALEHVGESFSIDDALGDIILTFHRELNLSKKRLRIQYANKETINAAK